MSDASYQVYTNLSSYQRLRELIADGETEGLYLECKAPSTPRMTKDLQVHLAKAISGFSNTAGGVVIWGMSTTKHIHTGLDVLTQIEPLGNAGRFEQGVHSLIPTLATPAVLNFHTKVLRRKSSDTRGVVIAHIPKTIGDPVQSNKDSLFYFRSGDEFSVAPYEMIKRLFSATESPDLHPVFNANLVKCQEDRSFRIPIGIQNRSGAIAEHVTVSVKIENVTACESITPNNFYDSSDLNPGQKIYFCNFGGVVYRGLNHILGHFIIKMKKDKRFKRRLDIEITLYANNMVAREVKYTASLAAKGCTFRQVSDKQLY